MKNKSSYEELQQKLIILEEQNKKLHQLIQNHISSYSHYKNIFEQSQDGNIVVDIYGNIIESNEAFAGMHGYTINEILGVNLGDLNIPKCKEKMKSRMERLSKGESLHFEVQHYKKNKKIITLDVVASMLQNGDDIAYFIASHRDISFQKKAENIIKENEANLKAIIENSLESIWSVDENYTIKYANDVYVNAFENSYGKKLKKGDNLLSLFPETVQNIWKERFDRGLAGGQYVFYDKEPTKDNSFHYVEVSVNPILVEGKVMGISLYGKDITERKNAEEEFRRLNNQKSLILNSVGEGIVGINRDGDHTFFNEAALKLLGYTYEEFENKSSNGLWYHHASNSQISKENSLIYHTLETGESHSNDSDVFYRKDGTFFPVEYVSSPIYENSKLVGAVVSFRDISERKIAEEALKESEEKYRDMANLLPQLLVELDLNGNITYVNSLALKMFGYSEDELIGKSSLIAHVPEERDLIVESIKLKYAGKEFESREFNMLRKDGSVFPALIFTSIIKKNNLPTGLRAIVIDISQQKEFEKELILAKEKAEESDRLKSAFLANMSHEIRTPMNGILGFASLLRNPELNGEQQEEYIEIIEKGGERMLNIINDIVNISKIEAGLMELNIKESNINEQIDYICTFFRPQVIDRNLDFRCNKPSDYGDIYIQTDKEKLYAVLTNLVKNAIKYTEEGFIEIGYKVKDDFLEFYVKDTGIGIKKDRQSAIFERFIQADIADKMAQQGAGLGLAISKAYVEMLGGEMWLESKTVDFKNNIRGGSTFYFTIPFDKAWLYVKNKNSRNLNATHSTDKKIKVLIAEDDLTSQMFISIAIKDFCSEIIKVNNGADAVNACRKNKDIDLILMDIQMPNMNGYEATKKIREFNKDVIIIAQTAYALEGDKAKAIANGCNDYITKPVNINELKRIINKLISN